MDVNNIIEKKYVNLLQFCGSFNESIEFLMPQSQ